VKRTRDLTKAQFERAMLKHGWCKEYFGYWIYRGVGVHPIICTDGKPHYREKLAYMIQQKQKIEATP